MNKYQTTFYFENRLHVSFAQESNKTQAGLAAFWSMQLESNPTFCVNTDTDSTVIVSRYVTFVVVKPCIPNV